MTVRAEVLRLGVGLLVGVVLAGCRAGGVVAGGCGSYLYQPAYAIDQYLRLPVEPYAPQPGDMIFAITDSAFMRIGHRLAGAAAPHHSAIVFARPDGSLAVLEAGPFNSLTVTGWDVMYHLLAYEGSERVWVRKRRCPLTPDQSWRLTQFCTAQVGKPFATLRVAGQLTPFRSRGPCRTEYVGQPQGDRRAWFCAELVVEALVAACLLDAETARPAATYPRDLFFDRSPNPWLDCHLNLSSAWAPPALWTSKVPGTSPEPPRRVHQLQYWGQ